MPRAPQPLSGVDRFQVNVEQIGTLDVSFVGPLELSGEGQPTLVLRRPLGPSHELFDWFGLSMASALVATRDVGICQLDRAGTSILQCWVAREARPVRWRGPSFDALAVEVAEEELELTYERLDWPTDLSREPCCGGIAR